MAMIIRRAIPIGAIDKYIPPLPGNLSMRENLVVTSAFVRTYRLWGRGRGVPRQPDRGWRMPSFLGAKARGAFGQPAFLLEGNYMTTVVFEKEVFLKLSLFSKTI